MDSNDTLENQIANLSFLEEVYRQSQTEQLDPSWNQFFQKIEEQELLREVYSSDQISQKERINHLIEAYRRHGHLLANINPIALEKPSIPEQLKLEKLGFSLVDQEEIFPTLGLLSEENAHLKTIVKTLQQRYCQSAGFEFKDLIDPAMEEWIQEEIESGRFEKSLTKDEKFTILDLLTRAENLETFLHTKHVGKKRFSLQGAETLIPMLSLLINQAAEESVEEFYLGMSHRGRLNVLANILDKPISSILHDFDEEYEPAPHEGMGDIRYHKGHANETVVTHHGKSIRLTMTSNPSHLESVNPVVKGQAHAKQFLVSDEEKRERIIPLLIHGDAALSGQGVVYETLQMSRLRGFETGGALHFVVNNQIGFTTLPSEGRSTLYCTDIAKTFKIPVFHVNSEDPEMCVKVSLFAYEIRQKFHCDVFIDLNCYRKYGHNEGDEPAFTQPLEYQIIRKKASIATLYLNQLLEENMIEKNEAEEREQNYKKTLQDAYQHLQEKEKSPASSQKIQQSVQTKVDLSLLKTVAKSFTHFSSEFHPNPKVKQLFAEREKAVLEDKSIDWGTGELLAYGTLVCEGIPVRLAGQDSGRGTFSHRHALWIDQVDGHPYYPLAHIRPDQARFEVLNTCLSEVAALGFEYGYSTVCTEGLTIWEAQYGDFANSAQVMIDQYIVSGEEKWGQTSNVVLLLPHGFEGHGPEHSSARYERFLSLAARNNMQIVNPTTPAQFFHLLRRQVKQPLKKPLVVMTPKGFLRHSACISRMEELTHGQFFDVLDDSTESSEFKKIVFCSGRIYFDLDAERKKQQCRDIVIIRIEQLYPLNEEEIKRIIMKYRGAKKCQWVQDEPENMGAWPFISSYLLQLLPQNIPLSYVGRERSASPATGFHARHQQELVQILHQVFHETRN